MPERLESWPIPPSPFDDYLDGSIWKTTLDEWEYEKMQTLRNALNAAARKHDLKIKSLKLDETTLVFEAQPVSKRGHRNEIDERRGKRLRGVSSDEKALARREDG